MRRERVTADEPPQAARRQGHADLAQVTATVLETDGMLTVLTETPSSLQPPPDGRADGQGSEGQP